MKWAFRLAALTLTPLVILAGLEGILRLVGYGYPAGFFRVMTIDGQRFVVQNDRFSWRFFPRQLARHPLPLRFNAAKPAGTYRIFVMGESAAMGDPEPAFAFSRILEVLLKDRSPQSHFEVINVAFTAINSHVILPIAQACARQEGDLWIIYMGHNEVPGPYGPGTVFGQQGSRLWLTRATVALKATRIGQLLDACRTRLRPGATPRSWRGLGMFLQNQFRPDDSRLESMYAQFRANLTDIIRAGRSAGADILLCTAASNLKDSGPFGSLHPAAFRPEQKAAWDRTYPQAVAAELDGRYDDALSLLRQSAAIDPDFAELAYLQARCQYALGRFADARRNFDRARDLDTLRFRTDSRLNQIVEETATQWRQRGVFFCNTVAAMATNLPNGVPGAEMFLDHVHLTFDGNYLLARAMADQILPRLQKGGGDGREWASAEDCAKRLALTPWHEYQICEVLQRRLLEAPFTNQLDHAARQQHFIQKLIELRPALSPEGLQTSEQLCRDALAQNPADPVLHETFGRLLAAAGKNEAALAEFQQVARSWPEHSAAFNNIGLLCAKLGRPREAEEAFREALARRADFADAHNGLGLIQAARGDLQGAIASYQLALRSNPELVEAQVNLGQAFLQQGQPQQAEAAYQEALRLRPTYALAHLGLADLQLRAGKVFDAIAHLSDGARGQPEIVLARTRKAVQAKPDDPLERFKLANVLAALHQTNQALEQLEATVGLKTNFWQARYLLGVELGAQGKLPEAQQQFATVVQLEPGYTRAHLNLGVTLARQMRLQEAAAEFAEVLRLEPTNHSARLYAQQIQSMTNRPAALPPAR